MKYSSIIPLIGGESIAIMNKLNGHEIIKVLPNHFFGGSY